jgi:hypothetical protein
MQHAVPELLEAEGARAIGVELFEHVREPRRECLLVCRGQERLYQWIDAQAQLVMATILVPQREEKNRTSVQRDGERQREEGRDRGRTKLQKSEAWNRAHPCVH